MKVGLNRRSLGLLAALFTILSLLCLYSISFGTTTDRALKSEADGSIRPLSQLPEYIANTANHDHITLSKTQWEQCLDPGAEPAYYLSIVIVTRMDDYAGNQHHRFQNFIDSTYILAERTKTKIELLIVEWNPPKDKRRIVDAFRFRHSQYLNHRIITVPKAIHDALPNVGNAPLHEFEGKNVGIRFARGEFIVCTNQDDIWSHNFHNAIQSRVFEKNVIYLQHQDHHNIHAEKLPPSLVKVPIFADDDIIYNACQLGDQDWGNYTLAAPMNVTTENILDIADQAGDFTMAHRDTWKIPRGYREAGGVAWMDIEFICTATWTYGIPVVYSKPGFTCHQDHQNIWEFIPERHNDNKDIDMGEIMRKEKVYINKEKEWGLQQLDIWDMELECLQFRGGLVW
ncbi:uncharacterized protein BYT42DRAFT_503737 [Radiomyces spectabilis]|uniref:uncharacterized protein n=1 Tax=Radiomyces spectabilis TaxID=64574 RepID=UPI00221E8320|nr:uncharacterized protein BYT42DRAFT_503737 [Radiomyces spectabilis]KAI8368281.1 hypothetical protein BYT42DRAFT_503737 [Radiomyces spectabilis]